MSSSSECAVQRVNVRACVFDEYNQSVDGVEVHTQLVMPPPGISGVFNTKPATYISAAGQVLFEYMFQGAWYDIWIGYSPRQRFYVPYTSELEIGMPPVMGNDSVDPCL